MRELESKSDDAGCVELWGPAMQRTQHSTTHPHLRGAGIRDQAAGIRHARIPHHSYIVSVSYLFVYLRFFAVWLAGWAGRLSEHVPLCEIVVLFCLTYIALLVVTLHWLCVCRSLCTTSERREREGKRNPESGGWWDVGRG